MSDMSGKTVRVLAFTVVLALCGAGAAAAATHVATAAAPKWRTVKSVSVNSSDVGQFGVVVASGKTTGWAFEQITAKTYATSRMVAWERTDSTWQPASFPAKSGEVVVAAAAISPSDVWAVTGGTASRVLRWNGHTWSAVKTFGAPIAGISAPAANDVWVFGNPYAPALGVWHYNGRTWSRVSTKLTGGSALSATDVWAFSGTSVDHWNGRTWTATSVQRLLPPVAPGLNDPAVYGVLALSASDVFAVGNGRMQDSGGPIVVLHYDGKRWTRVADGANTGGYGDGHGGQQVAPDGSGGLWIPTWGAHGPVSFMLHYSAGKLTVASLPGGQGGTTPRWVSLIPGTRDALAGGFTHASYNTSLDNRPVILQYS